MTIAGTVHTAFAVVRPEPVGHYCIIVPDGIVCVPAVTTMTMVI